MIERAESITFRWLGVCPLDHSFTWFSDPFQGIRFCRKQDAEQIVAYLNEYDSFNGEMLIADHIFYKSM